ncbi:glutamate--tRNA ligase 2 [Kordiimonas sediminis]|uniref:Glutamate--tRNA ligase n=1 Tax=Kordiimonas sediminis TaxID=1735581 RepID=A0A919AXY2_9PROT|nr:glutamate--tRNA ligase [Kordiimonas sediminis]GHF28451.1 glutamate--tRNA ligase 2 [Kordiimonas sediminis]
MKSDMPKVVTRFAPSPTGFLHIGGARTALYNWLFAQHHGGKFLLRIEDTDRKRSSDEAIDAILHGMKWLGLDWDGEAVSQFAQAERHREVAYAMLESGHAYKCYATPEEIAERRDAARANGTSFRGDIWRDKDTTDVAEGTPFSVRIKMPREGEVTITDHVQGDVTVQNSELDDMILLRSDGTPTYMLSVCVDDHDMGVTHIIRGDDHLNNAFRQYQIYEAMGWDVPEFAHIPLIHGPDGKKLSKRHGALGVEAYEEMGFLPEALRNYLLRLGWSHGDEEIISTSQAIEWFTLGNVGRSPARFDFDKLDNLNGHYLRNTDSKRILELIEGTLSDAIGHAPTAEEKEKVILSIPAVSERAKRLPDIVDNVSCFCNIRPLALDDKAAKTLSGDDIKTMLSGVIAQLAGLSDWTLDTIKPAIMEFAEANELKLGKVMQPVRAAVTGGKQTGDLIDTLVILGKEETLSRLADQTAD